MGLTRRDADDVVSQFETALYERASLPDSVLSKMGYSDEQIKILHSYANGEFVSESELRLVTATCTGHISLISFSNIFSKFKYQWEWDMCPTMTIKDSAAMRWLAYNSDNLEIGVDIVSQSATVNYYSNLDGTFNHSSSATFENNLDFNSLNAQFDVGETIYAFPGNIVQDSLYSKTGNVTVKVSVPNGMAQNIAYIKVAGLYGHTTLGLTAPSISLSPSGSISIGFSGSLYIDPLASYKVRIDYFGVHVIP